MKKKISKYSSVIIDAERLFIYEQDVKEFLIEYRLSTSEIIRKTTTPAEKSGDFIYVGKSIVIDGLLLGATYLFRITAVKTNGETSQVTDWESETIGDTTNDMTFSNPTVESTSTAVTFSVTLNNIASDFEKVVWSFIDEDADIADDPVNDKPNEPTTPDIDTAPDYESLNPDDISFMFSKNRTTWRHAWVKVLDTSGNVGVDNWFYVGCSKIVSYDPQVDQDATPPDLTKCGVLDMDDLATSINALV